MVFGVFVDFAIALLFTILVEWGIAFFFGFRTKKDFFVLGAINLVTNPLLNYFILVVQSLSLFRVDLGALAILEGVVVVVEWRMLLYSVVGNSKKFLLLSSVMNLCSFSFVLILFHFL
jgi:hypothetical protein